MSAIAQRLALKLKLNSLEHQVPRAARNLFSPARSQAGLAAEIAKQIAAVRPAQATVTRAPVFRPPLAARATFASLFDVPTLMVSLAATGLLVGSAFATMILTETIDAPWSDPAAPPSERREVTRVLSASAANAPMPLATQPSAPPVRTVRTVSLPAQDESAPEALDDSASEAASDGVGLFGDVQEVYRGDGQTGVPFGAIQSAPGAAEIPEGAVQARMEDPAATVGPAKPQQAAEDAEATWIELPISVNLRRGPSRSASVIGVVEKGTRLKELERQRGWVQVIDPETQETGWLYPNSIPRTRRAAKQPTTKEEQSKSAPAGPFATLGNLLGKPAAPSQPAPLR